MLYNVIALITILLNMCRSDIITYTEIGAIEERIEANNQNDASSRSQGSSRRRLLPGGLTSSDKLIILNRHNQYRNLTAQGLTPNQPSASNMNQLLWDNGLAKVAQNYSSQCIWAHNPNRRYQLNNYLNDVSFDYVNQYVGENLFISTGTENLDTILRGIEFWYNENAYYTYGTVSGTGVCQSGQQCGHYTQLVWAKTRYVGCGYTKCATVQNLPTFTNAILFACDYYFAGNYVDDYPYETGTTCSQCPEDRKTCEDGLCTGCPSRAWDTYCCEYCSSSTCSNSISKGLCNSPSTCTDGIISDSITSDAATKSPTTTTTSSPTTTTTTNSPTTTTTTTNSPTIATTTTTTTTTTTKSPTTTTTTNSPTTKSPTIATTTTTTTTNPPTTGSPTQQSISNQGECCLAYNSRYTTRCGELTSENSCDSRRCYWNC